MNGNRKFSPMKPIRLPGYDYSCDGIYFVTICTENRECYLGDVVDGRMVLSAEGRIVVGVCKEIPSRFEGVRVDTFLVMPNHIHLVIVIGTVRKGVKPIGIGPDFIDRMATDGKDDEPLDLRDKSRSYTREGVRDLDAVGGVTGRHNPMLSKRSLSKIIRWFKGRCTSDIRKANSKDYFGWQGRFYEHIIRTEANLRAIRKYIKDNPSNWERDELHPRNINF